MRWFPLLPVLLAPMLGSSARGDDGVPSKLSPELCEPVRLEAAGRPIDTETGHAAPFVADWFGEGKNDLLVGQFGGGALWIYKNIGTNKEPRYAAGVKFKDGGKDGRIPAG